MVQAEQLVHHFHKIFHGVGEHAPQSKEIAQAISLITKHGLDQAKYVIEFAGLLQKPPISKSNTSAQCYRMHHARSRIWSDSNMIRKIANASSRVKSSITKKKRLITSRVNIV